MGSFRRRSELELLQLSDDEVVTCIRAAHRAEDDAAATLGLRTLVFGHLDNVIRRVSLEVPAADVEDVEHDAMVRALNASLGGRRSGPVPRLCRRFGCSQAAMRRRLAALYDLGV